MIHIVLFSLIVACAASEKLPSTAVKPALTGEEQKPVGQYFHHLLLEEQLVDPHRTLFHSVSNKILFDKEPSEALVGLARVFGGGTSREEIQALAAEKWRRPQNLERWQVSERYADLRPQVLPYLQMLGMLRSYHARQIEYDYAVVLGGVEASMQRRLNFLTDEWTRGVRFKQLRFLVSARVTDPASTLTEAGIAEALHSKLPQVLQAVPVKFVSAKDSTDPARTIKRANTADTIKAWTASEEVAGSRILAVSSNPNIGYQNAVLSALLPADTSLETIGPATEVDAKLAILLDALANWLRNIPEPER